MVRQSGDLCRVVPASEITMRLQPDAHPTGRSPRHFTETRGYLVARLFARRARLYFVWEDADQPGAERGGQLTMFDCNLDLLMAFNRVE